MGFDTYAVYQEAKQRIANRTHDAKDEVIVSLWDSTSKALTETTELRTQLDDCRKTVAQLSHQNDIMASRLSTRSTQAH